MLSEVEAQIGRWDADGGIFPDVVLDSDDPEAKVYRMYYQTTHYPSGVPGVSFRQDTCYAESKDAITWTRPKLGLVDFKGSKENNILFPRAIAAASATAACAK